MRTQYCPWRVLQESDLASWHLHTFRAPFPACILQAQRDFKVMTDFAAGSRKLDLDCFCAPCLFGQVILIKRQVARFTESQRDSVNLANFSKFIA